MSETTIQQIRYRTVFDSRGVETLEFDVRTRGGGHARVAAPFGAPGSRGEFEAPAYAPGGLAAMPPILDKEIIPALTGLEATAQSEIDELLSKIDGTANFERIGGNTSSTLSIAVARAAADTLNIPLYQLLHDSAQLTLPTPLGNIIGGGAHSLGPAPDMQEHLVLPMEAKSVRQAIEINLQVHHEVGRLLEQKNAGFVGGMDDEDAWAANLDDFEALEFIEEGKAIVEDRHGIEIRMGLDLAADRLWDGRKGKYCYSREGKERTPAEQLDYVRSLIERFRLVYVEDAFNSNDYDSFAELNRGAPAHTIICGDDIYASNSGRTLVGLEKGCATAMVIKPNQVGTLTGARKTAKLAQSRGTDIVISNRSGETADVSIADLGAAWNALLIKAGVRGGGRIIKLNELIRIEQAVEGIRLARR